MRSHLYAHHAASTTAGRRVAVVPDAGHQSRDSVIDTHSTNPLQLSQSHRQFRTVLVAASCFNTVKFSFGPCDRREAGRSARSRDGCLPARRCAFERDAGARHDEGRTVVRDRWACSGRVSAYAGNEGAAASVVLTEITCSDGASRTT